MNNKVKLGIIGGGLNSTIGKAHISALRMDGNFQIVSGYFSRNTIVNNKTNKSLGLNNTNLYKSVDDYIKNESGKLDAFLVLSDTFSHFLHIKKLLKTNKTIICEKPSSKNLDEFKKLNNLIKKNKIKYFPFYNYTGYPIIRDIKNLLNNKSLGNIENIELSMPQQSLTNEKIKNAKKWRLKDSKVPTIQLDLGVHLLIILKFIYPTIKIKKIISHHQSFKYKKLVHTIISWFEFNSGGICKVSITKNDIGQRNSLFIKINGSQGSLEWSHNEPENLIMYKKSGKKLILDRNDKELKISKQKRYNRYSVGHPYGFIESMANYYQDIYEQIKFKDKISKRNLISINDESFAMKILEKSYKSNLIKKWIDA